MLAFVNGSIVEEAQASVDLLDHGFTVGDGVFETIAVRRGRPVAVAEHLQRLEHSAACLGLRRPEGDRLARAIDDVLAANPPVAWGALRLTYTSGPGEVGSGRGRAGPTTVLALRASDPYRELAEVITVPWPRNERGALAGVKTTSYAENTLALADAHRQGASEALFANTQGNLCEGTGSNVFVVVNGELLTPPLSAGCLAGITRAFLIERCGLAVAERDLPLEVLYLADEAFLTSTVRDVQPIRSVDGRGLASCPGPVTEAAQRAYSDLLAAAYSP